MLINMTDSQTSSSVYNSLQLTISAIHLFQDTMHKFLTFRRCIYTYIHTQTLWVNSRSLRYYYYHKLLVQISGCQSVDLWPMVAALWSSMGYDHDEVVILYLIGYCSALPCLDDPVLWWSTISVITLFSTYVPDPPCPRVSLNFFHHPSLVSPVDPSSSWALRLLN